ncbi:MAG TPA: SpoIIE family protein phosphatase [Spirochaetia bacterium]|nr:SpoIIE family protein phosphatase [Spirochaetia bacterium]
MSAPRIENTPLSREEGQDYRARQAESLARINRIAGPIGLLIVLYLAFMTDPVSYPGLYPLMRLGRYYAIGAAAVVGLLSFFPWARRVGVLLSFVYGLAGLLMMAHLTAVMNNESADVVAWLMLSIVLCGIYPLPLSWSVAAPVIAFAYYFLLYFSRGFAVDTGFRSAMINVGSATVLTLAFKIGMERIRKREYVFRVGLQKANAEIATLNDQLKDENVRLSHEIAIAAHIQNIVLPQEKEYGAFRDLDISCRMIPATEVGGDFYDTIVFGPQGFISIGDVTDHGLHSGLIMMMVHTALRALSQVERNDIQRVFKVINRVLYDFRVKTDDHRIMSLAILKYLGEGGFVMTGQHESLLILRADGTVQDIDSLEYGMYAGLDANVGDYLGLLRFELALGDVLVLYTDGVTEALNEEGQQFGVQGVIEASLPLRASSAKAIETAIVDACQAHLGTTRRYDDVSVVVVKKTEDRGWDGQLKGAITVGDRIDFDRSAETSFTIRFLPLDMFDHWNRGSMLSDFTAEYFRHNFPDDAQFGLISTVVNELVENAVKFTANNSLPVELTLKKAGRHLMVRASNAVRLHRAEPFMAVCRELFASNLDDLYLERVQQDRERPEASGLGLLLIRKDYSARLGFEFRFDEDATAQVTATAELALGDEGA